MPNKKPTKSDCSGCYNDFYNRGNNGLNGECWSFKEASEKPMIDLILVYVEEMPPHRGKPTKHPVCYRKQRYVGYRPDQLVNGYTKAWRI